jgi:biotin carboxyl carrier protein
VQLFLLLISLLLASTSFAQQSEALSLNGSIVQGGMVIGQTTAGSEVWVDQRKLSVSDEGLFVFGLDRDAKASVQIKVREANGHTIKKTITVKRRDYAIQRIEGIAPAIMNPSADALVRIKSDSALVRAARKQDLPRQDYTRAFQWPLKGPISGVYGSQRFYNGEPKRPHYGVDIAAPSGTPVSTPTTGVVTVAHPDMFYSGGTVIIDHGQGISSTLMHLSKVHVEVGDEVAPGDIVGEVGSGGRATGPHLDWRMNWFDRRIDPVFLVEDMAANQPLQIVVRPELLLLLNINGKLPRTQ